jgi:hypothetical protein
MILLLAVAIALYGALLANSGVSAGGGEDAISQAYAGLFLTLWLWLALALLLIVGAIMGRMPVWALVAMLLLHPISGIAAFVALDAASRRVGAGVVILAVLPPAIAAYAFWARLTQLHEAYPPRMVSALALGAIAFLSVCGFLTGL